MKKVLREMWRCTFLQKKVQTEENTGLDPRCLNQVDIFMMCVGVTSMSFYYEMPYIVNKYGYLVFFPLILSGVVSLITCATYAEMISITATSGGVYRYVYYSMGEYAGFLTGWIDFYISIIRITFCVRILTKTIDFTFINGTMRMFCEDNFYIGSINTDLIQINSFLHLDSLFALAALLALSSFSVKHYKPILNIASVLNMAIIIMCLSIFWFLMDISKFDIISGTANSSSFMGASIKGNMFYSDLETTLYAGAEAANPTASIPHGLLGGFQWGFCIYMASVLLYSIREEVEITDDTLTPMQTALSNLGFTKLHVLPTIGQCLCFAMSASARMYAFARLLHTMAKDGMVCRFLGNVNTHVKTPLIAHLFMGGIVAMVAVFIGHIGSTDSAMLCLGDLMRCFLLISHLVTRYRCELPENIPDPRVRWLLINYPNQVTSPTKTTHTLSMLLIVVSVLFIITTLLLLAFIVVQDHANPFLKLSFILTLFVSLTMVFLLSLQPQNDRRNSLYVIRNVPITSFIALSWYIMILLFLPLEALVKSMIWLLTGTVFYYCYACRRSTEFIKQRDGS